MVFLIANLRTGFIVDSVAEVLRIHKSSIEFSPSLSGAQTQLLARMANLDKQKRLVQLLDPAHLVEGDQLASLAAASA
jgi:purine-binding chemotaxis protein CheW